MERVKRILRPGLVLLCLLTIAVYSSGGLAADGNAAGNQPRRTQITVDYTKYEWWLIPWASPGNVLCTIFTDHEGLPTAAEILKACGSTIYNQWRVTPPCTNSDTSTCTGYYLFLASQQPAQKTISVDLPQPVVWIDLTGCVPSTPENICRQIPALRLTGEEPLPNEHITAIHAILGGKSFTCQADTCDIPLQPTTLSGVSMEFWADSSYGDSSAHFTAQIRVVDTGATAPSPQSGWYIDVLSSQWRGRPASSCAQTWQSLPPVGGPPSWLLTPEAPELLATGLPYSYLAGRLISEGIVDASDCPGGGLLPNGYADACGLQKALPEVQTWQNQFDARIIEVAKQTGVPAQLLKNLFAQESQFWPGMFTDHLGLGHITDQGAEVLLLWNSSFYNQFCPLVLDAKVCNKGYVFLDKSQQALLRGALALQAKSDCNGCSAGIDLTKTDMSINLFAQTLLANCEQVAREVYNATNKAPGAVASYEDLWRFTIANYHAGPGCLSYALYGVWSQIGRLDWDHVRGSFTTPCKGVVPYVEKIAR